LWGRVVIKSQINSRSLNKDERGATAIQLLVILVPAAMALIGFAVDLGIIYSIKGELKSAAGAMAIAAASRLMGTDASADSANAIAQVTANNYYFNGFPIGQNTGTLTSTVSPPALYATLADALGNGGQTGGALARHVRVDVTAQTKLLFWSFLPVVTDRNITVAATAVAGMSAPLCQACGIEPYAVAAIDQTDTTDFGFVPGTKYSFAYLCTGTPQPTLLPGASQTISYVLLNRLDPNATVFADESSQAFRDAAGGMPGNTDSTVACFRITNTETIWLNAAVLACNTNSVSPVVTNALCGLDARFESTPAAACSGISAIDQLAAIYPPDTDLNDYDVFTDYAGDGRRIITIPIVDTVSGTASMTVLGFRQFLLIPGQGTSALNPADPLGRFVALYAGSVAPVKQGRFDGCQISAGPGKVVLHQ
jgi:Flp pilus assembly protein TadG